MSRRNQNGVGMDTAPKRLKKGSSPQLILVSDKQTQMEEYEARKIRLANALAEKKKHPDRSWKLLSRKWSISDKTLAKYWKEQLDPSDAPRPNERRLALKSDFVEQRLVQIVLTLSDSGAPLTSREVTELAETMARDLGTLEPDQHLSRQWLGDFKARRPVLSSRVAETLSSMRSKASTPELQRRYVLFKQSFGEVLDSVFVKHNVKADFQISSFDELHLDSSGRIGKPVRVVGRKGTKSISRPSGPVEVSGHSCSLVAGGTASFAFSPLILIKASCLSLQAGRTPRFYLGYQSRTVASR